MINQERSTEQQAIYKNTCHNERSTALQEHTAEATTLSLKRSQLHTIFYLFVLNFIPFMSSYNI